MQRTQQGFTLIELIMVIVILGILSAFALPKFADLSGNAEDASVEGARGSVRSAAAIAHAACLADSACNASGATSSVTIEGSAINMVYGYPSKGDISTAATLDGYALSATATGVIVALNQSAGAGCFIYTEATATTTPAAVGAASSTGLGLGADTAFGGGDDTCP